MGFVKKYKEINACKGLKVKVRSKFRSLALTALSQINRIKGVEEILREPRIQFLYFHHIFQDEEDKLRKLIERLSEYNTFISYSEAVQKILNGTVDKPYIVFSSDDGFKNNLRAGEIFNRYGIEVCFFINPSIVGVDDYEQVKTYCRNRLNFPPVEFLDWDEVNQLQRMGHEIGSHTMNHINIAETEEQEVQEDIQKSLEVITHNCGSVKHFAFPYGRFFHFNEEGRAAVFDAGFNSCATAERGCHVNPDSELPREKLCIRRDHIVLDWDIEDILYFIVENAKLANTKNNLFPYT